MDLRILLPGDLTPTLDDHAIVQRLIGEKSLVAVYGPSNSGKSALTLDLAASVAMGSAFRGLRVKQSAVLYIAAEGVHGMNNRVAALQQTGRLSPDAALGVVPESVDLCSSPIDASRIVTACAALEVKTGHPVRLIVIDTLARVMAGGDENSGADMGALVRNADAIKTQTGATVLLIHHSGKDGSKGARGHSSFRAALDTEISVEGANNPRTVTITKQRDLAPLEPFCIDLRAVTVGMNTYGEAVTAVVVEHSDAPTPKRLSGLGKNQSAALAALREWAASNGDPFITTPALTDVLKRQSIGSRQRRLEITNWLVNGGLLTKAVGGYTVERGVL